MAVWLIHAGSHGEYELKFIQENRVYVTWDNPDVHLAKLLQRAELTDAMTRWYPDTKPKAIANWVVGRGESYFSPYHVRQRRLRVPPPEKSPEENR